jgi:hypothetical protein
MLHSIRLVIILFLIIYGLTIGDIDNLGFLGHNEVNRAHLMDAEISGNRVFIANGLGAGLEVYDISDPTNPTRTFNAGPNAWRTRSYNDSLLFLFCRPEGLRLYDISGASPILLGGYDPSGSMEALEGGALVGDTIYCAVHQNGIYLISIVNPSSPQRVGIFPLDSSAAWNVEAKDSFLFVANGRFGLTVLGLTGKIHNIANLPLPGLANDIVIKDNIAVISLGISGLATIDISNPHNPILCDTIATDGCVWGIGITNNLVIAGSWRVMELFDISNPYNILRIGWDNTKTWAHGADIRNDSIIAVADWRGMSCYKIGTDLSTDIDIYPQVLDFGAVNDTIDSTVIVRNTGSGVLNVTSIIIPSGISAYPISFLVQPGDSQLVSIQAYRTQTLRDSIIYLSNDPDEANKKQEVYRNNTGFPQYGSLAPDFTLLGTDGQNHTLSDYRGRVVYLEFGGAW